MILFFLWWTKIIKEGSDLEYVIIKGNDYELWEIDYKNKIALDISEIVKPDSIENSIKYSGKIEDYLQKERGYSDIHFHDSFRLPKRIHLKDKNRKLKGCNFK
jgi:hypothetical protein